LIRSKSVDGDSEDSFNIEILGKIHAYEPNQKAAAEVVINDIGTVFKDRKPVFSSKSECQLENSEIFCFSSVLGRMPGRNTKITEWTNIAKIPCDWLIFPRKGKRRVQFIVYIISEDNGDRLGKAEFICDYENGAVGYIDQRENIQRVNTLAIALGFAVSAIDGKLYQCEIDLVKEWARKRFGLKNASRRVQGKIEKALEKTVSYFQVGKGLNVYELCKEIAGISGEGQRYDVLELCLRVAGSKGEVVGEELKLLHQLGVWLEVDREFYQGIQEKILPITMHSETDAEAVLGLDEETSKEEAQGLLNKEFRKWNARVTNSDPEIRKQADHMLNLIAHARNEYIS
jgi:tellurite resistance protein